MTDLDDSGRAERYSRTTRRTGSVFACIIEQPIGFAVPLFALIVFFSAPQMPDMFAGMVMGGAAGRPWYADLHPLSYGFAVAFLGFAAWYWSRAALSGGEEMDDAERRSERTERRQSPEKIVLEPPDWAREWAPRIALAFAALIACAPLIMTITIPGRSWQDAPILASATGIAFVIIAFLITRYRLAIGLAGGLRAIPLMWKLRTTSILAAAPFGWLTALALLALSLLAALLAAEQPQLLEAALDTPTAGLLALSFIIGPLILILAVLRDLVNFALFLLTLPARFFTRLPYLDEFADVLGLILLFVILYTPSLIALSQWVPPQLYKVRMTETALSEGGYSYSFMSEAAQRAAPAAAPGGATRTLTRPTIQDSLIAWKNARLRAGYPTYRPMPVIIIAAEGGASRAAVWLLSTMRMLDGKTKGQFGQQIFAISGVSGGSLGAVTYLEALRAYGNPDGGLDWQNPAVDRGLKTLAEADLLSASIATYFLNDTFGSMLGQYWPFPDRGQALEKAFEREWTKGFALTPAQATDGLIALRQDARTEIPLPHLFLNGTDAKTGRRIITSTMRFDRRDDLFAASDDLLSILERDVPASVAVTNSARFPYLSPAGRFYDKCNGQRQILDGGYFENYGARTASELAYKITQLAGTVPALKDLIPIVVVVSNDADAYRSREEAEKFNGTTLWRTAISCRAGSWTARQAMAPGQHEQSDIATTAPAPLNSAVLAAGESGSDDGFGIDSATPFLSLFAAHGAHGQDALHILRRQLCPVSSGLEPENLVRMVHLALPKPAGTSESAPMNWVLNAAAQRYLLGETGVFDVSYNKRQTALLVQTLDILRHGADTSEKSVPRSQ